MSSAPRSPEGKRIPLVVDLVPSIFGVIRKVAVEEDRSLSHVVERMLKTHPRVQEILEAEAAGVGA